MRPARFLAPLALLTVLAFAGYHASGKAAPVQAAAAGSLNLPVANCAATANATASVTFSWSPVAGQAQWLDIGTDEFFAPGTFAGTGPLQTALSTTTLQNLPANTVHYWRVATLSESGWAMSDVGVFIPCGAPVLLQGPLSCDGKFRARVTFRWAPSAAGVGVQYLDLGFDPAFPPDSFTATSALGPATASYGWNGVYANALTFFRVNALGNDGAWHTSQTGSFNAECAPPVRPGLIGSGDRLTIPRLGVDAPVNVRDVTADGQLGDPAGPLDVVRYTFPVFDNLGGYPGNGGTTMIAGHVDYRNYGLAVFAPLRDIVDGDQVNYYREDGSVIIYVVDWVSDLPNTYSFGDLARNGAADTLILITCNGDFNWTIGEYSHRRVVYATRVIVTQ